MSVYARVCLCIFVSVCLYTHTLAAMSHIISPHRSYLEKDKNKHKDADWASPDTSCADVTAHHCTPNPSPPSACFTSLSKSEAANFCFLEHTARKSNSTGWKKWRKWQTNPSGVKNIHHVIMAHRRWQQMECIRENVTFSFLRICNFA